MSSEVHYDAIGFGAVGCCCGNTAINLIQYTSDNTWKVMCVRCWCHTVSKNYSSDEAIIEWNKYQVAWQTNPLSRRTHALPEKPKITAAEERFRKEREELQAKLKRMLNNEPEPVPEPEKPQEEKLKAEPCIDCGNVPAVVTFSGGNTTVICHRCSGNVCSGFNEQTAIEEWNDMYGFSLFPCKCGGNPIFISKKTENEEFSVRCPCCSSSTDWHCSRRDAETAWRIVYFRNMASP